MRTFLVVQMQAMVQHNNVDTKHVDVHYLKLERISRSGKKLFSGKVHFFSSKEINRLT